MFEVRVGELVAQLGGEVLGNVDLVLRRIAPLDDAGADAISFLSDARHQAQLQSSAAGCVILAPALREAAASRKAAILSPDPYLYYARLSQWLARQTRSASVAGIHPSAVIEAGARIHAQASVGALAFVGGGAVIDARAVPCRPTSR